LYPETDSTLSAAPTFSAGNQAQTVELGWRGSTYVHIGVVHSIDLHLSGFLRLLSTELTRSTGLSPHFYDLCLEIGRRSFDGHN